MVSAPNAAALLPDALELVPNAVELTPLAEFEPIVIPFVLAVAELPIAIPFVPVTLASLPMATPPTPPDTVVVKPAVSCGSRDTVRYHMLDDLGPVRPHIHRLLDEGRTVMVQPYVDAVDTAGETALVYLGGRYSHAIRKGPLLARGVEGEKVEGLFVQEQIDPREPTEAERAAADAIVASIPGGAEAVLYARVDLIPDDEGRPLLLELELTEPSLFLSHCAEAPARLASAIAARL